MAKSHEVRVYEPQQSGLAVYNERIPCIRSPRFNLKGTKVQFSPSSDLRTRLLLSSICLLAVSLSAMAQSTPVTHLLPEPRETHFTGETSISSGIRVLVSGHDTEDEFAAHDLAEATGEPRATAYRVSLLRSSSAEAKSALSDAHLSFTPELAEEGYILILGAHHAEVIAESATGIFYGVQTLKQLLPLAGTKAVLPIGTIRDWPAMRYRGIDDDLSRGPFPTLEFQKHQVREFAAFKLNIYSPYFEHTLSYEKHPVAAPPGSAMTKADVEELVRYAKQFHVTILPEQEAFGHLHHVLKYDLYKDVAETPHGHVLAPGQPGTLPLIKDWFTEVADEFPSPFLHIGADETFDLGLGLTHEAVAQQGYGPVYVKFLKDIHDTLAPLHRRLLFWGDIGGSDPKAVASLPKDMIAVPWNYWDTKGFDKMLEPFSKAGIETWVAPGDANWSQVYPIAATAFGNIQGFVREGQKYGSTGALTTVWNDDGEGLFNMDWYGVLFGGVAAWQSGESSITAYQASYGATFHGDQSGKIDQAQQELMAAETALGRGRPQMNSDDLFWIDPWSKEGQAISVKMLPSAQEMREHAERAIVLIAEARAANPHLREQAALDAMDLGARRYDFIGLKFELSDEMIHDYATAVALQHDPAHRKEVRSLIGKISDANGRMQDLRDGYSALRDEYSTVWLEENRSYWLNNVLVRYDLGVQLWQKRGDNFQSVIRGFESGKDLPSAESLGIPVANN